MRTVYIAFDDTEFESAEECRIYEAQQAPNLEKVRLFDGYLHPLSFCDVDSFVSIFAEAEFAVIPSRELTEIIMELMDIELPYGTHLYYDENEDDWVCMEEAITEMEQDIRDMETNMAKMDK